MCEFEDTAEDIAEQMADAIVEDTVHCSVCHASYVCGDNEPFVVLDPPGEQQEAAEYGCQEVKLCESCVKHAVGQWLCEIAGLYGPDVDAVPVLVKALQESVKLQSHYANVLNMHDGGERRQFGDVEEWINRLRECGAFSG